MSVHGKDALRQYQALPLEQKILLTKERIRVWYESWTRFNIRDKETGKERFVVMDTRDYLAEPELKENEYIVSAYDGQVYVSFSGGKDSTVLLHMAREMYPDIEAVFVNTGLEFPEIQKFVKTFDNVTIIRPEMRFDEVIKKCGYPMISKAVANAVETTKNKLRNGGNMESARARQLLGTYPGMMEGGRSKYDKSKYKPLLDLDFEVSDSCCRIMKKNPVKKFEHGSKKMPILATMACESIQREASWMKTGCNGFSMKRPMSKPMSFWTEQDVLEYIKKYNIPIAPVYGEVVYTVDPEQMRFEECGVECEGREELITTGMYRTGCIFCGFGCHLDKGESRFERLKRTHPRQYAYCMGGGEYDETGVWKPNKKGLGMKHVFDELNKIYGEGFIKY